MKSQTEILRSLENICSFVDEHQHSKLLQDVELISQQLLDSSFRIALLAPFNFGKSTLINALLGAEVMPTKMIRTTGTAISIKYGKTQKTIITLNSGEVITSHDLAILKEFAVLDKRGRQRQDVVSIEVLYPHSLLKKGVELLDLPGTNDREEQDILVRDRILQVDLVIQILNAQQPFTLEEKANLQQWVVDRGIKSVVFVINWMNKLEAQDERTEVYENVLSVTNSFQSELPNGIKNLYVVNALPALEAKQKRSSSSVERSGLAKFEVALRTIIFLQKPKKHINRLPRVSVISQQVIKVLEDQIKTVELEIIKAEEDRNTDINMGKVRETILQEEFSKSISNFRNWLSFSTFTTIYGDSMASGLENNKFYSWKSENLELKINFYTQIIESLTQKISTEFNIKYFKNLYISLPDQPKISLPNRQERSFGQSVSDLFNGGVNRKKLDTKYERKKWQFYKNLANSYLSQFSKNTLESLDQYEIEFKALIKYNIPPESHLLISRRNYSRSLKSAILEANILQEVLSINSVNTKINRFTNKIVANVVYSSIWIAHASKLKLIDYYTHVFHR